MDDLVIGTGLNGPEEADALALLFFAAVREGATSHYDAEQRQAWAPSVPAGLAWSARLLRQTVCVARKAGRPVGFMTLESGGYLDLAFVAPGFQRLGIGRRLCRRIEEIARATGEGRLHTQASLILRPLLKREGWRVLREQEVERSGVLLRNTIMEKTFLSG